MWIFWLIATGIFFISEMLTTGFLVFWLGVGSLIALGVSFLTPNLFIQTAVFVFSSIILIFSTKPLTDKMNKKETTPTNFYTLKGKKGLVIEEINPTTGKGQIKVGGEVWSAVCDESIVIPKDSEVEIINIQGVKAYVSPLNIPTAQN